MPNLSPADNGPEKGSKYPYYPINSALRVAEAVKELGGARTPVTRSLLAKHLKEEEGSGAFSQQITSAKIFGVVEGYGSYTLSDIARHYYFPTSEGDKSNAIIDVFRSPPAYRDLVKRFDGNRLPSKEILGNIMHRELGVPASWKDRSAALFLNSAQSVGVIDDDGILRVNANLHQGAADETEAIIKPTKREEEAVTTALSGSGDALPSISKTVRWSYKSILVQTPEELGMDLWNKLNGYVQLLKPSD